MRKILSFLVLLLSLSLFGCSLDIDLNLEDSIKTEGSQSLDETVEFETQTVNDDLVQDESYTTVDQVALYLHTYSELPSNYITKSEAISLGWISTEGNLWEVTEQKSLGGDTFYNREGLLPKLDGRRYYECDVNYEGGYRGADRIVYSNDGLVYYTQDHYESFTLLYGDE